MARVVLDRVWKDFGSVVALKDLSFETGEREFLVLLGPAGAGKTTTLKILAGLEKPTRGRVYIDGQDVTGIPANQRNVAMTFEGYALYPTFSVYENLKNPFGAMAPRPTHEAIDARIHEVARMLEIDQMLDRKVDQLSGGQKQRVSLARSMVRQPQVFLFDEPLSHVDAKIRHTMRAELHRVATALATTTVYVTHDYVEALSLGDRILVINQGVVQQIGTPDRIYHQPANIFVAKTVGQPGINLVDCQVQVVDGRILLVSSDRPRLCFSPAPDLADALADRIEEAVRVGIRPRDIRISFSAPNGDAVLGRTELYEVWGRRGVVLVIVGETMISVLSDSDERVEINRQVWLDFSHASLHIFDQTGMRIAH
jgi:ABC-type sugar transport system ATPase subunit